ncbi:MAG: transporter substrate-binding domain-containing protein [Bacilli bacterium]
MRKKMLFTSLGLVSALLVGCQANVAYNMETETKVIVGLEAAYAPFNWTAVTASDFTLPIANQPGSYVDGYDVAIARMIGETLNKEIVIKAVDWLGLIPALGSRDINIIIAGMSPTDVRKKQIAFSDEYYRSEIVLIVKADGDFADANSIDDFTGAKVVAQLETVYDRVIDQIPQVNHLNPLDDYAALTLAVVSGSADAFVAELPVAKSIVAANPSLMMVRLTEGGFDTLEEDITVAIGVRKIDTALLSELNRALAEIDEQTREQLMDDALARSAAA